MERTLENNSDWHVSRGHRVMEDRILVACHKTFGAEASSIIGRLYSPYLDLSF